MITEALSQYIRKAQANYNNIEPAREASLEQLAAFVRHQQAQNGHTFLNMICTHNSRRSHMVQVWGQVAAFYYGIHGVSCYSGGTEVTAFNPSAVKAISDAGNNIMALSQGNNPVYAVKFAQKAHPIICFSKVYDHPFNVQQGFAAVMTCAGADANCPFIPNAAKRISLYYNDPKEADGTPQQAAVYAERCFQIATEMLYAFSLLV